MLLATVPNDDDDDENLTRTSTRPNVFSDVKFNFYVTREILYEKYIYGLYYRLFSISFYYYCIYFFFVLIVYT